MKPKIKVLLFFTVIFCTISINSLYAQEYSIVQLTDNNYDDRLPKLDNGQIIWEAYVGNEHRIFLYNSSDIIQLTNNASSFLSPKIHDGQVVWLEGPRNNHNIFLYNGSSIIKLTNDIYDNTDPEVHDGQVVWKTYDGINYKIFLYTGSTIIQLADNAYYGSKPHIHNGHVVWVGHDGHDTEIFLYNGITTLQLTNNNSDDTSPQIHNGQVVWVTNGNIFLYNGSEVMQLTDGTRYYQSPKIHNGQVIWVKVGNYSNSDEIYLYNGSSIIQLSNKADVYSRPPKIHNGQVIWRENYGQNLFLYNGTDIIQLTNRASIYTNPQIYNGQVVWVAAENIDNKLFIYDGLNTIKLADNVYIDIGSDPQIYNGQVVWINRSVNGDNFEIFLATPNLPPVLNSIGNKEGKEGEFLQFTISATDPDVNDTLTYSASNLPEGANFDSETQTFTWTPDYNQAGTYSGIKFIASDGSLTDEKIITITVNNTNRAPVLNPIGNKEINENTLLQFTVSATDPDGDTVIYSAENLPSGANFNTQTGQFSWMPDYDQAGSYQVTFTASDGNLYHSETITITVNNVNGPPVFDPTGDKTVERLKLLRFYVHATDPDEDSITYDATNMPRGAYFNKRRGMFIWVPRITQVGDFRVTFIAKDGLGNQSSETIIITVPNSAPVLNPIGNKIARVRRLLRFRLTASDADRVDHYRLRYYVEGLPRSAFLNRFNGDFIWIPRQNQRGVHQIRFYVKDIVGAIDEETISITVY